MQLNVRVPETEGGDVAVVVTVGDASSQPGVTMALE